MRRLLRRIRLQEFNSVAAVIQFAAIGAKNFCPDGDPKPGPEVIQGGGVSCRIKVQQENVTARRDALAEREIEFDPAPDVPGVGYRVRVIESDCLSGDVIIFHELVQGLVRSVDSTEP